jgi:hypothetical protein
MAKHASSAGRSRPWRSWLHGFVREMASDDWEQPRAGPAGPEHDEPEGGPPASLDEVLRDAAGARDPDQGDGAVD